MNMAYINRHVSIIILNVNGLNIEIDRMEFKKKHDLIKCFYKKLTSNTVIQIS